MIPGLELLDRLRDAHPPEAPSWWPPAPGWWLVLVLALALALIALRWLPAWWRRLQLRRRMFAALERAATAAEISQLLRLAVLARFPERGAAGLHGESWAAFLESCDRAPGRFAGLRQALGEAPYRSAHGGDDIAGLRVAARAWMRAVL